MGKMRNIIKSTAEYTESFSGFRGIAPMGDDSVKSRLAYCENVYRDYDGDNVGAIESVPGYRLACEFRNTIYGIFTFKKCTIIHSGTNLYQIEFVNNGTDCYVYTLAMMEGTQSTAFAFGNHLYVLDGKRIVRVNCGEDDGLCSAETVTDFYVPMLYLNGKAYEARNLLTDSASECYDIIDARENATETEGIRYSILDADLLLCSVSGIDEGVSGEIDIPGYKTIGGVRYQVYEIANSAFHSNHAITSVRIGEGVKRIGKMAFYRCTALERITTPVSLVSIEDAALNGCPSLTEVYLREGLSYVGAAAFAASLGIQKIHYEGSEEEFKAIEGCSLLDAFTKEYYSTYTSIRAEFKLCSPFESVERVTIDGEEIEYTLVSKDGAPKALILSLDNHWQYNGTRLTVEGRLPELKSDFNGTGAEGNVSGATVIHRCKVAELFDGRVFLAGNPDLPSTVFYCSRTRDGSISPLYFGELNYFKDGTDASPIVSLLSVRSTLAVFKQSDDGMGGIFYHAGRDTGDDLLPRIYPVTDVHSGTSCLGGTLSFLDEAFFISPVGLSVIEKQSVSMERSITQRSGNIASHLLREKLRTASIHEWMGYIAVCCGQRIYLADPRATFIGKRGNLEYEWFIINGVGKYTTTTPIYRYSDCASGSNLSVKSDMINEICTAKVYSGTINGQTVLFTREGDKAYEVYRTDEHNYSLMSAPTKFHSDGYRMFFVAGYGELYMFNNDLRGAFPPQLKVNSLDYPDHSRRIHPYFYSFAGVAPRYVLRTVKTSCSVPHLTKSTVKGSLVVKLGRGCSGKLICEVGTDKNGYRECSMLSGGNLDFATLDFSSLTLAPEEGRTIVIREKEKGWVEKDITLYSDEYAHPIVVYGLAFRYKIKGRIKQK